MTRKYLTSREACGIVSLRLTNCEVQGGEKMRKWMEMARKNCGITMKTAATSLGISESYYSMIERGERQQKLDIALAVKMSEIFGVSLEYIVNQEGQSSA